MILNNFVITTLSDNPEYFEEVIRLIEEEFHYSENQHYDKDFAPLVDPLNFENCYLYIDQETNTVASHLAVCTRTIIKNNCELKVALIGGIATHKQFRKRNLFKNLMNHALRLHGDNVGLFILWSDIENLYEKFSFYRTGGVIETGNRIFSASDRPSGYEKTTFSALSDKEFNSIISLYTQFNEKYFFTIKRDQKDWSIIREMNSIDLYIKKNFKNEIEKYFCINKGKDLTNIIHEISCKSSSDFPSLLKDLENFKLWLPETNHNQFPNSEIFYTAFVRLGAEKLLNEFLNEVTGKELKILKKEDDLVVFDFKGKEFQASHKDFLQYILGPKPLLEFERYNLSLYITGADSV